MSENPAFQHLASVPPEAGFFYAGRQGYAMEHQGQFIPLPAETMVRQHLMDKGFPKEEIPAILCDIRTNNYVCHFGPLAGWPAGIHVNPDSGGKMLITQGPTIIEGRPGPFPTIGQIIRELLTDDQYPDQLPVFMGWLKIARRNVVDGVRRKLPAMALVGPIKAGKTCLLSIAQKALGGRTAKAYQYLSGDGKFNADLVGAELLQVDDEPVSSDRRSRERLAQNIKNALFSGFARIEAKGRDGVNLRPVWALMFALNDSPADVAVLPELDDGMADKISLLHCNQITIGHLGEDEISRRIDEEMPAFIAHLEAFLIPDHLTDTRTTAAAWQSPRVLALMDEVSPHARLLELIRQCPGLDPTAKIDNIWQGTADEVRQELERCDVTRMSCRELLRYPRSTGIYLAKLAGMPETGITKGTLRTGIQTWLIRPEGGTEGLSLEVRI